MDQHQTHIPRTTLFLPSFQARHSSLYQAERPLDKQCNSPGIEMEHGKRLLCQYQNI